MRKNGKLLLLAAVVLAAMCISDGCGKGETGSAEDRVGEVLPVEQEKTPEKAQEQKEDAKELCVDVERVEGDSVIGSRIETYAGENGQGEIAVSTTVEADKELLTIRFAQDAVYTYRIIRDGGADVETREGGFADIKAGLLLDLTGHYDGEAFLADTVTISDVRTD